MEIGIYDLNECSTLSYKERLNIYKNCGFTSVGVYLDENYMSNEEAYADIIGYAKEIGLKVNQVHVDYKISNLISNDESNVYFDYVEGKLNECIKLEIPYMVLHASKGNNAPLLTDFGLERLKKLMKKYENSKVFLCFENVRDNRNLETILLANINNVGMCYDLGHAHCYSDEYTLLNKFKSKILCTHLHNNNKEDTHNTLLEGEVDCKRILPLIDEKIDNCLEVFPARGVKLSKEEFIDFVKKNYNEYVLCVSMRKIL